MKVLGALRGTFNHEGETVGVYEEDGVFYYKTSGLLRLFGTDFSSHKDASDAAKEAIDRNHETLSGMGVHLTNLFDKDE